MSEEATTPQPVSLARGDEGSIRIEWSDGRVTTWTASQLRHRCPCATCREKRRGKGSGEGKPVGLPVLSAAEARPLRIEAMRPVGNYAYNIAFSDGHASGIFQLAMLHAGPS